MGSFVATGRGVIGGDISGWMSWSGGVGCHKRKMIDYESCFFFNFEIFCLVYKKVAVWHKKLYKDKHVNNETKGQNSDQSPVCFI